MVDQEQRALTISEVAVDWQEPMVLQRKCSHPLHALTDISLLQNCCRACNWYVVVITLDFSKAFDS